MINKNGEPERCPENLFYNLTRLFASLYVNKGKNTGNM